MHLSNRKFRPNPNRKERPKDSFFDWLHGKWHDGFCPSGPCVASAHAIADPQALAMQLRLNGETRQNGSTAQQIFPVAAIIAFISSFVTLEPGDMISTGTPARWHDGAHSSSQAISCTAASHRLRADHSRGGGVSSGLKSELQLIQIHTVEIKIVFVVSVFICVDLRLFSSVKSGSGRGPGRIGGSQLSSTASSQRS